MASNAVNLANLGSGDALTVDTTNDRVGIASTNPTEALSIVGNVRSSGIVSATTLLGTLTGDATGLTGTPDITVGTINATTATFSTNVTIGGTLTYEDVTSIDSVGIVTAQSGIRIGTGGTVGPVASGIVTYFGDGSQLSGVAISVSDDTSTNSTMYPTLSTGTSGNLSAVKVSSSKLTFNPSTGQLNATDINSSSDANLKENISPVEHAGDILSNLTGVNFTWKETQRRSIGVIAQELEEILPELVSNTENGKSVNYNGLIGVLIEAVKELSDRVDQLENK